MAVHEFYIYSADAYIFDGATNTARLREDYDPDQHRLLVRITDDDEYLDGDQSADEVGEDANQTAEIFTAQGDLVTSGPIYAEAFTVIHDDNGEPVWVDHLEIGGQLVGYATSQEVAPGDVYTINFTNEVDDGDDNAGVDNRTTYSSYEAQSVPCFLSGTLLMTDEGLMPIDWIAAGDKVMTLDRGLQTVRWRGHREFRYSPDMPAPIEIAAHALGPDHPREAIRVSPQHRIVISGPTCELFFGEEEVLVAAKHLLGLPGVTEFVPDLDHAYHHLLFDQHEVLISDGLHMESLFLADVDVALTPALTQSLAHTLAPGHAQTARRCLKAFEALLIELPHKRTRATETPIRARTAA